jgi:RHS repeat-associated protein
LTVVATATINEIKPPFVWRVAAVGRILNIPFLGSKERDTETGLDYFLARYYSNIQGRFTSVDPENAGAIEDDPQSWNGYAYARNAPSVYSDPDGRAYAICSVDGKDCYEHSDEEFKAGRRAGRKDGFTFSGDGGYFEKGEIRDKDGNVIATYEQTSLDSRADQLAFAMQLEFKSPDLYKRVAGNLVSGAIVGHLLNAGARPIGPERQLGTRLPQQAERTLEHIEQTGRSPAGYVGGRRFQNDGRGGGEVLPRVDANGRAITYRESDVNPYQSGVNRGAERLVTGSDGSAYYTSDHYRTFIKIK